MCGPHTLSLWDFRARMQVACVWAAGRCSWARLRPPPPPRLLTEAGLWHHPGERASPGGPEGCQAIPSRCRPDRSGREAGPFRAGGPSCPPLYAGCTYHMLQNPEQLWGYRPRGVVSGMAERGLSPASTSFQLPLCSLVLGNHTSSLSEALFPLCKLSP